MFARVWHFKVNQTLRFSLVDFLHFSDQGTILCNHRVDALVTVEPRLFVSWDLEGIFLAFVIVNGFLETRVLTEGVWVFDCTLMVFESGLFDFLMDGIFDDWSG